MQTPVFLCSPPTCPSTAPVQGNTSGCLPPCPLISRLKLNHRLMVVCAPDVPQRQCAQRASQTDEDAHLYNDMRRPLDTAFTAKTNGTMGHSAAAVSSSVCSSFRTSESIPICKPVLEFATCTRRFALSLGQANHQTLWVSDLCIPGSDCLSVDVGCRFSNSSNVQVHAVLRVNRWLPPRKNNWQGLCSRRYSITVNNSKNPRVESSAQRFWWLHNGKWAERLADAQARGSDAHVTYWIPLCTDVQSASSLDQAQHPFVVW